MLRFTATLERFDAQGEKTGWTFIRIPARLAVQLHDTDKKSFRVKGRIDETPIAKMNLLPMGEGDYIMAIKGDLRRKLRKTKGDKVNVSIEKDHNHPEPPPELIECLDDEPEAKTFYESLTQGHRNYFTNWINAAKTEPTRTKRIAMALSAFARGWGYPEMIRAARKADY